MPTLPSSRGTSSSLRCVSELKSLITVGLLRSWRRVGAAAAGAAAAGGGGARRRRGGRAGAGERSVAGGRGEALESLAGFERGEHEVQLGTVVAAGERLAQRHEQLARAQGQPFLAPAAIVGQQVAGLVGRQVGLRRRAAQGGKEAEALAGGGDRLPGLAFDGGPVEHRGEELRHLAVALERRLAGGGERGDGRRRGAGRQALADEALVLGVAQRHDPLVVQPVELVDVEDRRAGRQGAELEVGDEPSRRRAPPRRRATTTAAPGN